MRQPTSKTNSKLSADLKQTPLMISADWQALGNLLNREEGKAFLAYLEELYRQASRKALCRIPDPSQLQEAWQRGSDSSTLRLLEVIHNDIEKAHTAQKTKKAADPETSAEEKVQKLFEALAKGRK